MAPLTHELGETATEWGRLIGRVAEDVARTLEPRAPERRAQPTPISGRRRSAARVIGSKAAAAPQTAKPAQACLWCGKHVRGERRTCRGECERAVRAENAERFTEAGTRVLEAYRAGGGPAQRTDGSREQLGKVEAHRIQQAREWQREKRWPTDPGLFAREILPALAGLPAAELARRTGLSVGYCRRIKKGVVMPHPMWWEKLKTVAP